MTSGDISQDHSNRWRAGRLAAVVGGLIHIATPQLLVLRPRLDGPTVDPLTTTWALAIVGIVGLLGAAMVGRLPTAGRIFIFTAALVSVVSMAWQFQVHVVVLSVPLLIAVFLLFVGSRTGQSSVESRRSAIGSIALGGYILWRLVTTHQHKYGSTHPESVAPSRGWHPEWMWLGAVQPTSATVTAGGLDLGQHALSYWTDLDNRTVVTAEANDHGVARFELAGLSPGENYDYLVHEVGGGITREHAAFRTPKPGPQDVTIAFGSCARTASNGAVFDAIRATDPDLFVQLGDLHYGNLASNHVGDHIHVLGRSLSTPAQAALYSSVPSLWIWDDHDYGPNNSDSSSPARNAVLAAYRQAVPHWGVDPDIDKPINQAMTLGRVRVISSDTRSMRTRSTMLGDEQEAWLISELVESAKTHALVVWAMPTPWNYPDIPGSDVWGGFPDERRRIANAIASAGITNLVMISGDWHHSAIDDGTNTGYADDGSPGFPLIHGAPLDRPGARTNDPYSHGVFSNAGQFGTLEVIDGGGSSIGVTMTVHLWNGDRLAELPLSFDVAIESAS